jgi:7-cyano-7-deazaguanine synthase
MARYRASVACVSGGMDSAVAASEAALTSDALYFLHVSYGQRTEARELASFQRLGDHFGVRDRLVAALPHLARIGGSSLVDERIPVEAADLARREIPSSYVPFRNAQILAVAVSWAEVVGAEAVYFGAVSEDGSGYPDCRPEFYRAFQALVRLGTRPETRIEIVTPVIHLRKSAIVRRGLELGTPFEFTWSCYRSSDAACGRCDSCALRLRGFREAGAADPIPYKNGGGNL